MDDRPQELFGLEEAQISTRRVASLIEAATLLRYQGRLISAMRLLDEAHRRAEVEDDGESLVRANLGMALCWLERGLFTRALESVGGAADKARRYGLSSHLAEVEAATVRVRRTRILWWGQVGLCMSIVAVGMGLNPLPLDPRLDRILPPWASALVPLVQFGGVSLTLAQIVGLFFVTSPEHRHLVHRFRFPHLLLIVWGLLACVVARFVMPGGEGVPYGVILAHGMLVFIPLIGLVVAVPLFERWKGGWKPLLESALGLSLLIGGLQMPNGSDLLVVSDRMLSFTALKNAQTTAWFDVATHLETLGYGTPDTLYLRAQALASADDERQAIEKFEEVLERDSTHMQSLNDLAWLLLTAEDAALHDGGRALPLAERAVAAGGGEHAYVMDTYAEALFQAGRVPEAIQIETEAIEISRSKHRIFGESKEYQKRLERFQIALDEAAHDQEPASERSLDP